MAVDSQEIEHELNEFYRDQYRGTMKWLFIMVIVCAFLSATLIWMTLDRKQPSYYASTASGKVVMMYPLSEPVVTSNFIRQWSALTVRRVYNLNFSTYQSELSEVQDRFTPDGWDLTMNALKKSGLIQNLVNNRLIISSVVTGDPLILSRYIIDGRFTWVVQMKLLVTFTSASAAKQQELVATLTIQRVPTLSAAQGVQIVGFKVS